MKVLAQFSAIALAAMAFAPSSYADGRTPGSVLIYPIHRSGTGPTEGGTQFFTIMSVTNSNLSPTGGTTDIHIEFVNTVPNPDNPHKPLHCHVNDLVKTLTPADTLSLLTTCVNGSNENGYMVVSALDPDLFLTAWSFNHLMGSEVVITGGGASYALNAMPFDALADEGDATDDPNGTGDGDGQLDFDGSEYEGVPDELYIDSNLAVLNLSMAVINLTGGSDFIANLKFDAWNDFEQQLSATFAFKCWTEVQLREIGNIFDENFLANNTLTDPRELDVNCDGVEDFQTSWARIKGTNASAPAQTILNPAIVAAITGGSNGFFAGRLLWESKAKQFNGDFFKQGAFDPEF
jgi:hypothetical protein